MNLKKIRVTSGVDQLDKLLDELYIGDNVVWHDDAGSLAAVYCLNFVLHPRLKTNRLFTQVLTVLLAISLRNWGHWQKTES